ncbi:MAG: hypothetical protein Q4G58_11570 [bacterium]|nr:hypothetical protein [bacterium]
MGVEQAIFTACETGITRQPPGFQVYSYSSGMQQILDTTLAPMMFQYEQPNYGLRPMTETMDSSQYPRKFAYSIVEESRRLVCLASNRMVNESRYGNYFSHVLATNLQSVTAYPCEYYKSPLFLEGLSEEQRQAKTKPDFLYKRTHLVQGQEISYESVKAFLSENNRLPKLRKLLYCLLSFDYENYEEQKKILLFDQNDGTSNAIIYWIAAVTMVLPRRIALKISFSDYEYDPLAAPYRICGCVKEGTRYDPEKLAQNSFVFDFTKQVYPRVTSDSELFDIVELSYRVSRDCILKFHTFMEDYTYEQADLQLLDAYELYKLLTVPEYITKMTRQKLHNAFLFASNYAREETKKKIINQMVNFVRDRKAIESRILRELLFFFELQVMENNIAKERLVLPLLRILYEALKVSTKEEQNYRSIAKEMTHYFEQVGLSLYKYYLGTIPTHEFVLLLKKTSYEWKLTEAVAILKNYVLIVKPTVTEIAEDGKFNTILTALFSRCSMTCPSGKGMELSYLMKAFSFNYSYSTYLYLVIFRYFNGLEGMKKQVAVSNYYYAKYFYELEEKDKKEVYSYLLIEDEPTVIMLFHYAFERTETYEDWFLQLTTFVEQFGLGKGRLLDGLMAEAFENATMGRENRYQSVQLLFSYCFKIGYRDHFINRLIPFLSAGIPLVVTDEEQLELIKRLYFYQVNFNGQIIEKRVALAYRLYELKEFLQSDPKKRERITFQKLVAVPTMDSIETTNYLKRAGTIIGEIIYKNGQVSLVKTCYQLNREKEQQLLLYVYGALLNRGRRHRHYMMFLHTFVYALDETREETLARIIEGSGVKVKDINDQMEGNMQHLMAFRRRFDTDSGKEEKIASLWYRVIKRVLQSD